jgi:hypothetical protein
MTLKTTLKNAKCPVDKWWSRVIYPGKSEYLKICKNFHFGKIWIFVWFVWCVISKKELINFSEHTSGRGRTPYPIPYLHLQGSMCVLFSSNKIIPVSPQ